MKLQRNSYKRYTKAITIVGLVFFVCLTLLATTYALRLWPFNASTDTTSSDTSPSQLEDSKPVTEEDKIQTGSDPLPEPQPVEGSSKRSINAEITSINQSSTELHIRTILQTVTNSGTCTITMTHADGRVFSQSVDVQALSSSTTCKGFDIQLSELGEGSWATVLEFSNDNLSASTSINITVN